VVLVVEGEAVYQRVWRVVVEVAAAGWQYLEPLLPALSHIPLVLLARGM
jgi:hypothetical protein